MSNTPIDGKDPALDAQLNAQLDQLLVQASTAQRQAASSTADLALKHRILAAVPATTSRTTTNPVQDNWLDNLWQWFSQPLRMAAAAALPLMLGFALGNANLITDNELLVALSEQDSWALEQMLDDTIDDTTWSEPND